MPKSLALIIALLVSPICLADWPQWRGPDQTGIVPAGEAVPTALPAPLKTVWNIPVNFGISSPVVAGGRVYYCDNTADREVLHALDAADGKEIWRADIDAVFRDSQSQPGPRCTPAVDGPRVYQQSTQGHLKCLSAADGKVLWETNYVKDLGGAFIGERGQAMGAQRHGFSGPPVVSGDWLIAGAGGATGASVVAFDRQTGAVVWKSQNDIPGNAPPVLTTLAGRRQVIEFAAERVMGLDLADGKLLWSFPFRTAFGRHAITPVVAGDMVIISSHTTGLTGIRVSVAGDQFKAEQVWNSRELAVNFASPVLVDGHLYGVAAQSTLMCVEAATGKPAWTRRGLFQTAADKSYASFTVLGRNILMLTDSGQLILLAADPAGFREIGRTQICGTTWSSPAYSGGRLYVKDAKELKCVQLLE